MLNFELFGGGSSQESEETKLAIANAESVANKIETIRKNADEQGYDPSVTRRLNTLMATLGELNQQLGDKMPEKAKDIYNGALSH